MSQIVNDYICRVKLNDHGDLDKLLNDLSRYKNLGLNFILESDPYDLNYAHLKIKGYRQVKETISKKSMSEDHLNILQAGFKRNRSLKTNKHKGKFYLIQIIGDAKIVISDTNFDHYENEHRELYGEECEVGHNHEYYDDILGYFDISILDILISGKIKFKYESGKLMNYTNYIAIAKPTKKQVEELKNETIGQWSDGIGEGFEQDCFEFRGHDYYISMWHSEQKVDTIVKEISPSEMSEFV